MKNAQIDAAIGDEMTPKEGGRNGAQTGDRPPGRKPGPEGHILWQPRQVLAIYIGVSLSQFDAVIATMIGEAFKRRHGRQVKIWAPEAVRVYLEWLQANESRKGRRRRCPECGR